MLFWIAIAAGLLKATDAGDMHVWAKAPCSRRQRRPTLAIG